MVLGQQRARSGLVVILFAFAGLMASGCAILGPTSIKTSRAAYNDAIVATNNQQVLAMIVRMRYGEPSGLLSVSSVTANLNIQGSIGSEYGIGSDSSFEGNLVPLSAGIAYEDNPTISYTPVQGENYLRQLLSPLPMDLTVLMLGATGDSPRVATLLFKSINGIQNPAYRADGAVEADPRFGQITQLLAEMNRHGRTTWAQEPGERLAFGLALHGDGAAYAQNVTELYDLLGLAAPRDLEEVVVLPVRLGIGKPSDTAVQVRTRSLYELFNVAAASVEVPEEHVASGLAPPLPPMGAAAKSIRIRSSASYPWDAMIAIKHHGWWYSIDGTDTESKLTFRVLEALLSARMAEAVDQKGAPVLTVPASR